jgi:hypothetical protein
VVSYHRPVSRPVRSIRSDPREISELKGIAERHPELAGAVAIETELLECERRVRTRLATPWIDVPDDTLKGRAAAGCRLLEFAELPIDWTEYRLLVRQVTDILRRQEALDHAQATRIHDLGRGQELPDLVRQWYDTAPGAPAHVKTAANAVEMLDDVLALAARPFLTRTAEVLQQRLPAVPWTRGTCVVCGGDPSFAFITPGAERQLVCGRCQARWAFDALTCPFCFNAERSRISSFATPDGQYRVSACQACGRYLKALDGRRSGRPLIMAVDSVATLPLDAAAMQKGFTGG